MKVSVVVACMVAVLALGLAHAQSSSGPGSNSLSASVASASLDPTSAGSGSVDPVPITSSAGSGMSTSGSSTVPLDSASSLGVSSGSGSGSTESNDPTETDLQSNKRSTKRTNNGKVTIVTNKNSLVHIEHKKAAKSAAEIEAEERRTTGEERNKREEEERKAKAKQDELEAKAERQRRDEEDRRAAQKKREDEEAERKAKAEREERAATAERQRQDNERKEREERERREKEEREKREREERERKGKEERERKEREERERKEREERERKEKEEAERRRKSLQLSSGWGNYGHGYLGATVDRWGKLCFVSGLLAGHAGEIGILGEKCRPRDGRLIFHLIKGDHASRVDVLPDGRIHHIVGGGGSWLSLSGIWFTTHRVHNIQLIANAPYHNGYRVPSQDNQDGLVSVSGLFHPQGNGHFANMAWHVAHGRRIFSCNNHAGTTRCDIYGPHIVYTGGRLDHNWVSLDGIMWTNQINAWLPLYNGWQHYHHGYIPAGWSRIGPVCSLCGLIRNPHGSWPGHITNLPEQCRPRGRLIFGGNVHEWSARIDVLPDGQVHYVSNQGRHGWLSLEGIKFVVA